MRPLNYRNYIIPMIVGLISSTHGCSSMDYDRAGLDDELSVAQTDSLGEDKPSSADTETEAMDADEDLFDDDLGGTKQDSASASQDDADTQDVSATFNPIENVNLDSPIDSKTEEKGSSCPLNSGYPCACNTTACDDGSDCLAHGDALMGFCSRRCGLNEGRYTCETKSYGLPESSSGACAVIAQPESRAPDHCAVVCRQGDLAGDCPPHLVCTPAEGVDLYYCLPHAPSDEE